MTGFLEFSTYFGFFLSIAAFLFGDWLSRKVRHPLCNSMLIAVVLIIALLKLFRIDYETYNAGAKYLSFFITPAVVCLAIPVYQQFSILRKNTAAIFSRRMRGHACLFHDRTGACRIIPARACGICHFPAQIRYYRHRHCNF